MKQGGCGVGDGQIGTAGLVVAQRLAGGKKLGQVF